MIFHEAGMALPATGRLAVEIALHKCTDFSFGLRQSHDVGAGIQLALSVTPDDLVLPDGKSSGVRLINSRNTNIGLSLADQTR